MSYNGSGSFLINTAGQPVVSGTVISSTAFNALTADLATGLSTCITKDGQTTVTANIPMANYKFTGLGAGSGAADSANLSQVQSTVVKLLASVSGTDTITAVGSPTVAAYAAGQMFYFVAAGDNTGAVTLNIDSLGAKNVTRDGSVALAAGDIKSGEVVVIVYDGTRFQVVSQLNSSGDARFANVSIASALNVGGVATVTGGSVLNGGMVINEPGADVDFRVEGDTDANLIFADASTDRVGVGTNAPSQKLSVATASGNCYVDVARASKSTGQVALQLSGGTSGTNWIIYQPTNSDNLTFFGNSGDRMVLDSSGNLGLGVTPSAWGSIFKAVQVGTGGSVFGRSSGNQDVFQMGANVFWDGSNWKYIANGASTRYEQATGIHAWHTAASGTAGNTITFKEAMKLNTAGQLEVFATSGNGGRVDIYSNNQTATQVTLAQGFATATDNIGYLINRANEAFVFGTNNTERARITSGGDLGVGTTSPAGKIDVVENATAAIQIRASGAGSGDGSTTVVALRCVNLNANDWANARYNAYEHRWFSGTGSSTERARITSGGYSKFSNDGNYDNSSGSYHEFYQTGGSAVCFFRATSATYTGTVIEGKGDRTTTNSTYNLLDVYNGNLSGRLVIRDSGNALNTNGSYGAISDIKLKQDVSDAVSQWDDIKSIRIRKYRFKNNPDAPLLIGVIAQEIEKVSPGLVDEEVDRDREGNEIGTTTKSVKYSILYMKAVKALQEAMARIEKLETEVAALKGA